MMALGILLIVLAVIFGLGVSVSSGDSTTMQVFGVDFGMLVPTVFFLGAATGAVLVVGLWLTKKGLGRGYRRRKEVRELRQKVAQPSTAPAPSTSSASEVDEGVEVDTADDRLATEQHTVADGTETK